MEDEREGGCLDAGAQTATEETLQKQLQTDLDDAKGLGQEDSVKEIDDKQLKLKQLLEPLDKEKLKSIVLSIAADDSAIADQCISMAAEDLANRKLFVRGLAWSTGDDSLKAAFSEFGEIAEGGVAMDRATGKSRGFGFVTFYTASAAQAALREPNKVIDGRQTTCNLASTGVQNRGHAPARGGFGGGRGAYGRATQMHMPPPQVQVQVPQNGVGTLGGLPSPYERYLNSMYSSYTPPMMPPPSGYENMGR